MTWEQLNQQIEIIEAKQKNGIPLTKEELGFYNSALNEAELYGENNLTSPILTGLGGAAIGGLGGAGLGALIGRPFGATGLGAMLGGGLGGLTGGFTGLGLQGSKNRRTFEQSQVSPQLAQLFAELNRG